MTTYAAEQATRLYNQQRSLIAQAVIQEGYAARVLGVRKAAYLNRAARLRQEAAALEPARQAAMLAAKADAVAAAEQAKLRLDLQRARNVAAVVPPPQPPGTPPPTAYMADTQQYPVGGSPTYDNIVGGTQGPTLAASTAVSSSGPTPDLQTVIDQQNGTGLPTLPDENPLSNLRPPANVSVSMNPNVKIGLAVVGIVGAALLARKVMA